MADNNSKVWLDEIVKYRKKYEKFVTSGQNINDRYRGESTTSDLGTRFNILRANIATLMPALYAKIPQPVVTRRFKDKNPAARIASIMLERALEYEITKYQDYDSTLKNAIFDRLLVGRGTSWIRYEPVTAEQDTPDLNYNGNDEEGKSYDNEESNALAGNEPLLQVISESSPCDYVHWTDFAHNSNARTWEEVTWVGRKVCVEEEAGVKRFGEVFRTLPQAGSKDKDDDAKKDDSIVYGQIKKSNIWEIWHKPTKKVSWVCEGYDKILDERQDPLNLDDFFPCPRPLYSALSTDSLIPRADYTLYQDQAQELDRVTTKIDQITSAIEFKGFYASEQDELKNLLQPGNNGKMIPISNWPALMDKGGIKGAVDYVPINMLIAALRQLTVQRDALIQIIYQLSGIADIQRGASDPNETASAQQIKAQFSSIRLGEMRSDAAKFARTLLRMKAEIIAEKYQPEILVKMSGVEYLPEVENNPQIVVDALQLLRDEKLRNFQIDIQNDTLVEMDENEEKQSRIEFLGAVAPFMEKSISVAQQAPALIPVIGEMLLFVVRGFNVGQSLESTFEAAFEQMAIDQQNMMAQQQQEQAMMAEQQQMQQQIPADPAAQDQMMGQLPPDQMPIEMMQEPEQNPVELIVEKIDQSINILTDTIIQSNTMLLEALTKGIQEPVIQQDNPLEIIPE